MGAVYRRNRSPSTSGNSAFAPWPSSPVLDAIEMALQGPALAADDSTVKGINPCSPRDRNEYSRGTRSTTDNSIDSINSIDSLTAHPMGVSTFDLPSSVSLSRSPLRTGCDVACDAAIAAQVMPTRALFEGGLIHDCVLDEYHGS